LVPHNFPILKKNTNPEKYTGIRRYSLHVGIDWVILRIEQDQLVIIILDVRHRKHIYRKY